MSGAHAIRSGRKSPRSARSSPARSVAQLVSAAHSRRQVASSSLRSSRVSPVSSSISDVNRSGLHLMNAVVTSPAASASSADRATMVATTSIPATHSFRQTLASASIRNNPSSSIPATSKARNTARAVWGARQENIETSHASGVSDSDITGRASTDSSRSPSNESRTHSCSVVVRASNTSPHSVSASTLTSKSAVALVVSDGAVVVLLGAVVVLEVVVVLVGLVVVMLAVVEVGSCGESSPQLARAMMATEAPRNPRQRTRNRDSIGSQAYPGMVVTQGTGGTRPPASIRLPGRIGAAPGLR